MHPKGNFVRILWAIMKRELAGYFGSPVAYVFLVIFLLLSGFFTFYLSRFFEAGQADLQGFFQWHPWLFMFLVPAVAMRLWAEERRLGTLELLFTFPVTPTEAILGKFLAAWCFIGIALFLTFPLVLTTLYLGSPDLGVTFCAYVGSFLMAGVFLSVGSMTSALTRSQVVSFILAVVICLFLILAGFPPIIQMFSGWAPLWLVDGVASISVITHFAAISRGVLDLRDILYYLSVMGFMIVVNGVILQNRESA
ncbi:ABC transporter permease [Desulfosarcina sp. OttesenSCG-928-A07]|nr:ABC transporter permease [Desulfosarcina sp. OttesenSCG-928-G17]MDL2328444.1 ABC transporter permease [Desulfosarcina sp. OttesenSCG-928-A07]